MIEFRPIVDFLLDVISQLLMADHTVVQVGVGRGNSVRNIVWCSSKRGIQSQFPGWRGERDGIWQEGNVANHAVLVSVESFMAIL